MSEHNKKKILDHLNEEFLITNLWILDGISGVCIFEQYYRDITSADTESDLIVGFFSALLSFAQESFAKKIKHITMQDLRFFFDSDDYCVYVIATNDDIRVSDSNAKDLLHKIKKVFIKKFGDLLSKGWGGRITPFTNFSEDLKEIVQQEPNRIKSFFYLLDKQRDKLKETGDVFKEKIGRFFKMDEERLKLLRATLLPVKESEVDGSKEEKKKND